MASEQRRAFLKPLPLDFEKIAIELQDPALKVNSTLEPFPKMFARGHLYS